MATNNLPEEEDAASFIHRPNHNEGACVKGSDGRYEIPSKTKKPGDYFAGGPKAGPYNQDANGSDATIPYSMRKGDQPTGGKAR